jgi:V/A-type H+-transporting ATPase subunit I
MIVPMKKVFVVCQAKDADGAVSDLRKLGVMHVEHQKAPQGADILALSDDISLAGNALDVLSQYCSREEKTKQKETRDWKLTSRHIIDTEKRLDQLKEYSRLLKVRIAEWEQWGDFDPEKINSLSRRNIFIRFYQIPVKEINSLPKELIIKKISVSSGIANCAVVSKEKIEIAYKEILPPKSSLSAMKHRLEQDAKVEEALKKDLCRHGDHYIDIERHKITLEKELEFKQAIRGMGQSGVLSYLAGYVPIDATEKLIEASMEQKWAVSIREPVEEDNVPTFIRTPKWVSMIKPVLGLLGITPGYRELDVSAVFLVFFSIFFGILIGDAGYGIVYMLIAFLLRNKMRKRTGNDNIFGLFCILSSCAIIWGVLTGTFFGQEWLRKWGFNPLLPQLNDVKFMQTFCFFLGALHLSFAHSWRAALKFPSLTALADIGWICVLWSSFFIARTLILGEAFPLWVKWLIITGISLVIFFTNPQRNILKTIGEGLGTVALSLMNNFTDVVSYVRLFAVGLAGVAIAETANVMASGLGDGAIAMIGSVLIVVIGHALNIILGPMSVLVHGVRLNVLEFSGHASVTWSGSNYEPLTE